MSPLAPLLAPLDTLPGVGPATAKLLARVAGGERVLDLLFHLPTEFVDRRRLVRIAEAAPGTVATLSVEVVRHEQPATPRQPWRAVIGDGSGFAELVFFKPGRLAQVPVGARLLVSGKVEGYGERRSLTHPDHMVPADRPERLPPIDPVWPLTAGLFPSQVRAATARALALLPPLTEWLDPELLRRRGWPGFAEALRALHAPTEMPGALPRARLAYDEMLARQLAFAWARRRDRQRPGRALLGDGRLRREALARSGLVPTASQARALEEIDAELAAPTRMLRLLQGDVGSGKTLVALLAMLRAAEAGRQAALMAPTELLARQHHATLSRLSPVRVERLTGALRGLERRQALLAIETGRAPLAVGTHALFQDRVRFRDLALAVIDEQHRFGVDQRLMLGAKGERTDILVMTATPIPRTLLLTQWGEMEVSRLTEKPAGRRPIRTTLHSLATLEEVTEGVGRALARGEQVYWVCPLVSESEASDLAAAEHRFALLGARFASVGLAHGRQEPEARAAALAAFAAGTTRLLVATTVIEVGVDVPAASVMVVEHAERFGLSQLHQLRGRVGRGAASSYCLLLHADGLTEPARRRLLTLRDTEDGFVIADEDFRLRGGGDMLGRRQSGQQEWSLSLPEHVDALLQTATQDAAYVLDRWPRLETGRGEALRALLSLFGRGEAVRTLAAG